MSSYLDSPENIRFSRIEDLKWDISEIFMKEWDKILEGKWKEEKRLRMGIYLHKCIRIKMISMRMRYIYGIDS